VQNEENKDKKEDDIIINKSELHSSFISTTSKMYYLIMADALSCR